MKPRAAASSAELSGSRMLLAATAVINRLFKLLVMPPEALIITVSVTRSTTICRCACTVSRGRRQ
jgi:hypothetical protein